MVAQPHFLLFCDTHHNESPSGDVLSLPYASVGGGRWHFVLEQLDGTERLEAADSEAAVNRERLALLSVVRGLEALEQPSQVTLVTTSRYVARGLRYGLSSWRDADYMWERFGELRPVRNSDLWRRVDIALQFHGVKCRLIQTNQNSLAADPALTAIKSSDSVPNQTSPQESAAADNGRGLALPARAGFQDAAVRVAARVATYPRPAVLPAYAARNLHYPNHHRQPTLMQWLGLGIAAHWWGLAAGWIRWWRGRLHVKPALYGT